MYIYIYILFIRMLHAHLRLNISRNVVKSMTCNVVCQISYYIYIYVHNVLQNINLFLYHCQSVLKHLQISELYQAIARPPHAQSLLPEAD